MIYAFFIVSIILCLIYFMIGVLFFKGGEYRYLFNNFVELNRYVFYVTAFVAIFASKLFKHINIRILNNKIEQGSNCAKRLQNMISFFMFFVFFLNVISLFWLSVFNLSNSWR